MKISKSTVAWLVCLFIALTVMTGCSNSAQTETTPPEVTEVVETTPPTEAPTEPEGYRIAKDAYNGSDITEFTVDDRAKVIDENAFANCVALENFYCATTDIEIAENAFAGTENVVFHCYLDSTVDLYAREHGFARVYFDAFSVTCNTVNNGCVGLPITWSAIDVMPGQDIETQFVYSVYCDEALVFTSEPTTEDQFVYTPTVGGQYCVTVEITNDLTTDARTTEVVPVAEKLLMGLYEQDNELSALEPIEWRILGVEDGKALVISEYILTRGAYFNPEWIKFKYTYWARSCIAETNTYNYWGSLPKHPSRYYDGLTPESVPQGWYAERGPEADIFYVHARYWCNEVFYKENFTEEERERILLSYLTNPDNPRYGITGGEDTEDYVFFLSFEEMNEYMPEKADRKAKHTTYAYNQPIEYGDREPYYWMRSPGHNRISAMYVWGKYGTMDYMGSDVGHNILGYRPSMWITIGG